MKRRMVTPGQLATLLAALLAVVLGAAVAVSAQGPQQAYDLSWWTVDGGGGSSSGGDGPPDRLYMLDGTAGQPDPGPLLRGGSYQLEGGFWGGGLSGVTVFNIHLPLVLRGYP